jgi:small multidrug resistance pump
MCWLWLFLAIVLEVTATVCLKLSDGFSRFLPTALMALFYGASFFPMAVALRRLDVGIAYAVWSAVGTALMTIVGVLVFKEGASLLKLSAIVMIMVGVVCLNVASRQAPAVRKGKRTIASFVQNEKASQPTAAWSELKLDGEIKLVAKRN